MLLTAFINKNRHTIPIAQVSAPCSANRARKKAKIEDFRFHDLRHTTGSWLALSGKDIYTIAKILGHKDLRMSARYAHLSAQYLSDAVKGLDRFFDEKKEIFQGSKSPGRPRSCCAS